MFPQKFADEFEDAGINIHQPNLMVWWERGAHQAASPEYNRQWRRFLDTSPSSEEILDFGRRQASDYGLENSF